MAGKFSGKKILTAKVTGGLENYCCPDGRFHDFQETKEWHDMGLSDDDDMKAHKGYYTTTRTCKNCGYSNTIRK